MPKYSERRLMPFTQQQLYDMVADVEKYPEFIPWLASARECERTDKMLIAEMVIGVQVFRDTFLSKALLTPPSQLDISYQDGPFKYLNCRWKFEPAQGGAKVDFHIDFELKSAVLKMLIGGFFGNAVSMMVKAFEKRARKIYGTKA